MAPSAITEDYYMILEVDQTAGLELIIKSYRQLALKLHPDRNPSRDATAKFQRVCMSDPDLCPSLYRPWKNISADSIELSQAYETLSDETERRKYDLVYPSLKGKTAPSHAYAQEAHRPSAPRPPSGTVSEHIQIDALQKMKKERAAQWLKEKMIFESSISEIQREVKRFEQAIRGLASIAAAEAAVEAQKNSWGTWILSPLYKKVEESEEVKAEKDRARQERRIEKDMKERRLRAVEDRLKTAETSMRDSKAKVDAADLKDEMMIQDLCYRIQRREKRERQEREEAARKVQEEQMRRQQEQREKAQREAAEARRKQQEADRLAEQKRQEEEAKRWHEYIVNLKAHLDSREKVEKQQEDLNKHHHYQHTPFFSSTERTPPRHTNHSTTATCRHEGWWPKVKIRAECPECYDVWNYLLRCPGCSMQACPKCQAAIRPKYQGKTARNKRRAPPRVRTPSPDYGYDDYY
jgi:curved DNA-binding protein CbpA